MAEQQQELTVWDKECMEALKALGKTLGQMTLYKIGHPAVAATLQIAEDNIQQALSQTPKGAVLYLLDQGKVIANGRIIGAVNALPNWIPVLFKRFKLSSLSFKAGLTHEEIVAFCELAASRADASNSDAKAYLEGHGVARIAVNEAVYSIMSTAEREAQPPTEAPPADPAQEAIAAEAQEVITQAVDQGSIEKAIEVLVQRAVPDQARRAEVLAKVLELLKSDIEKRVEQVTRALRTEKTVIENEQARTQSVLSNMAEGVVVVDDKGKVLMMNPAAEQIYGTTLAQVAGTHLIENTGEEHVVTLADNLATPPGDKKIAPEVKVAGGDEVKKTLKSAGAVVQNEQGKVVGMVSTLSDAAKYKEVQRMQRDFVAHVTHELRAPLSSIRAALEILQGEVASKLKEDENRMLATAMKNSDRLAELINSILDFSKIESGQMQVYPKKSDAEKIGRESVDALGAWAAKKRISLSFAAPPDLPPVTADAQRTVQVLINLLSNAIKFTPVGGTITVRVSLSAADKGKFVEFAVIDSGPGIAKADQKKIFEKFVQIAAGEMHVGGTGLGLAIAKALVHLQGGKMWVESDVGKGAAFLFSVPIYVSVKEATPAVEKRIEVKLPWWKKLFGLK
ncbi:MAG: PAS domain S-box protein [Elusimicrobia bacterium]|nr:PAS domain S-box protein [Elusimicrobiota bacterium]